MPPQDRPAATVAILALAAGMWSGALAGGWPLRLRLYSVLVAAMVALSALAGWPWGHPVPVLRWNGLLATTLLAIAALLLALPLSMLLALARRARRAILSWPATLVIEAARGVPMPAQLLFASFVLPLLFDGGIAKFWMALAALTLQIAARALGSPLGVLREQSLASSVTWSTTATGVVLSPLDLPTMPPTDTPPKFTP